MVLLRIKAQDNLIGLTYLLTPFLPKVLVRRNSGLIPIIPKPINLRWKFEDSLGIINEMTDRET